MYTQVAVSSLIQDSLRTLWGDVAGFLPRLAAALIVFVVGWLIAVLIGKLAWHIVRTIQLDHGLESIGFRRAWERSGYKLDSAYFFYELVKWFFIILFLMVATNILGLTQVTDFLAGVVAYLPNVFVAAFIVLIGVTVARFLQGVVVGSVRAAELASANMLGAMTRWAVLVFSWLVALNQLNVAGEIIRIIVMGVVAAGALALGLAFGLGGRDHADDFVAKMRKHIVE